MRKFIWPRHRKKVDAHVEPQNVAEALALRVPSEVVEILKEIVEVPPILVTEPDPSVVETHVLTTVDTQKDVAKEPVVVADTPVEAVETETIEVPKTKSRLWNYTMNKGELLKVAQQLNISLDSDPTRQDILEALKAHDSND